MAGFWDKENIDICIEMIKLVAAILKNGRHLYYMFLFMLKMVQLYSSFIIIHI